MKTPDSPPAASEPTTILPAPVITSVSPAAGPTSGGNTVTLTGTNLGGTTAVTFGTRPATSFTVHSPTLVTAVAPAAPAGPVEVGVTTAAGPGAPGIYYYVAAPALTGVAPSRGPVSGGNTVTLTGTNLVQATAVRFGTTDALSFTAVSDIEITAVVPPGAGTEQITVTSVGGTSNDLAYTYLAAPVITGVVPGSGPVSGGNAVTLTGTGLTFTERVLFGVVPAAFTVVSDTRLNATAPPGAAGPVGITVTTPGGTGTGSYTRVAPPGV